MKITSFDLLDGLLLDISIRNNFYMVPTIILFNFSNASVIQMDKNTHKAMAQPSSIRNFGYDSPEAMVLQAFDLQKRDAWAIGMTMCVGLLGFPLYGFVNEGRQVNMLSEEKYNDVMLGVYHNSQGKDTPVEMDKVLTWGLKPLGLQMMRLLIADAALRPTPLEVLPLLETLAGWF
jgi:hypothetical protein